MAKRAAKKTGASDYLGQAVAALTSNTPFMATRAEMEELLKDPRGALVEFNENVKDGDKIAWRATSLGSQVHANGGVPTNAGWGSAVPSQPQQPAAQQSNPDAFKFDTGIPLPTPRRGGKGSGVYGFEHMPVGGSFFVPATDDNPNPAKRIASTVSSASRRMDPKKFVIRSVDETSYGRGKGARVWRTE